MFNILRNSYRTNAITQIHNFIHAAMKNEIDLRKFSARDLALKHQHSRLQLTACIARACLLSHITAIVRLVSELNAIGKRYAQERTQENVQK